MAERYMTCKKFGAEVHLTGVDQEDMAGTFAWLIEYSKDLVAKHDDYWAPDQFWTEDNPKVHYATTGPEIWDQSGGCDAFVAGIGTGGTLAGAGKYLKEQGADVFAVEPTESRATVGGEAGLHGVVGIGAGFVVPMIEDLAPEQPPQPGPRGHIDDFLHASTPESVAMANRLAAEEGLLVGPTSGAVAKGDGEDAVEAPLRGDVDGRGPARRDAPGDGRHARAPAAGTARPRAPCSSAAA
ncbi:hypothetical protein JL722_6752 [Aureococcus anophagefferens]|nr:hypothetical protein JL722_6752 [Aureococcus anophagefferens]